MSRILPALTAIALLALATPQSVATAEEDMAALAWLDAPEPAPEVLFTVEGGNAQTLADYRGKVIVLNFWAVWCPPCREEMPSLDRLQAAYGGDHLVVMAMSEDRGGENQIREFYDKIEAANLGIFSDPTQKVAREFHVLGMPTTFIIDHHGKLVAKLVGAADWDSEAALNQILPLVEQAAVDDGDGMSEQALNDVAP